MEEVFGWLAHIIAAGAQKPKQNRMEEHVLGWSKCPRPIVHGITELGT